MSEIQIEDEIVKDVTNVSRNRRGRSPRIPGESREAEARALKMVQEAKRPLRQKEFLAAGIHQQHLAELVRLGLLSRVSRGCYAKPGLSDDWSILAAAAIRWPSAVICGPTAAAFYKLIQDDGGPIWMAVPRGRGRPRGTVGDRQVRVREWLPERLLQSVRVVYIDGVQVSIVSAVMAAAELVEIGQRVRSGIAVDAAQEYLVLGGSQEELNQALASLLPVRGFPKDKEREKVSCSMDNLE
jgi:hypothetical protein